MKKYQLNEELAKLEKRSKGITLKQQILENLVNKFEHEALTISQTFTES
jgi:hypothetical protein